MSAHFHDATAYLVASATLRKKQSQRLVHTHTFCNGRPLCGTPMGGRVTKPVFATWPPTCRKCQGTLARMVGPLTEEGLR